MKKNIDRCTSVNNKLLTVTLEGSSMFPTIFPGDKALVKKVTKEELNLGDIIVWKGEKNDYVSHRIVAIDEKKVITKGDFLNENDSPVLQSQIIGKIVAILRDGKVFWINNQDNKINGNNMNDCGAVKDNQQVSDNEPLYKDMQVLDLRKISSEFIKKIEAVENIKVVLLSQENAASWDAVKTKNVGQTIVTDDNFRVYTGQPELLPEVIEFLDNPLKLIIVGQLFLTRFSPIEIIDSFEKIILYGQLFVNSVEVKEIIEKVTEVHSGYIEIIPEKHVRWIGQSVLGPEFLQVQDERNLVALGELNISKRDNNICESVSLFHVRNNT